MRHVPFLRLYAGRPALAAWAAAVPARKSAGWRPAVAQRGRRTAAGSMTSVMAPTDAPSVDRTKIIYIKILCQWHTS